MRMQNKFLRGIMCYYVGMVKEIIQRECKFPLASNLKGESCFG